MKKKPNPNYRGFAGAGVFLPKKSHVRNGSN